MTSIPTEYANVMFRSRLEAKWAVLFDLLEWPWAYEPLDLDGYIPDYVLPFRAGSLLVEVKPDMYAEELDAHRAKIERSGWCGEALIVGCSPMLQGGHEHYATVGLYGSRIESPDPEPGWAWDLGVLHRCFRCGSWSVCSAGQGWVCVANGCYDGARLVERVERRELERMWGAATNRVQWRGRAAE